MTLSIKKAYRLGYSDGQDISRAINAELVAVLEEGTSAMDEICDCGECGGCQMKERHRAALAKAKAVTP